MSVPAETMIEEKPETTPEQINLEQIGSDLRGKFTEAETERQIIEQEWLKSLRQYKGIYDPDIVAKFQPNKSQAFIRLTRTKVKSTDARVMDMLFPAGTEKNWQIEPTPVSEISMKAHGEILLALAAAKADVAIEMARQQGTPTDPTVVTMIDQAVAQNRLDLMPAEAQPTEEEAMKAVRDDVKERCDKMSKQMDDQLTEARYPIIARDVIHSGNLYGTGILKGPLVERKYRKKWVIDKDTRQWVASEAQEEYRPFAEYTPVWDVYPDQSVSETGRCEYFFQRHVMSRQELRKLKRRPDYNAAAIEEYIAVHPEGDAQHKTWEVELRNISKDENFKTHDRRRHYEVLEYWGVMDGADLQRCGCQVPEEMLQMDVEVNAWLLGNRIIKLEMNPAETGYRPYHFYYFEKDDTSIWGIGIPDIYRWAQQIVNASMRASLDNLGITAGPVYEINLDLLDPDDRPDEIFPFRIIFRRGKDISAQYPAVRVHEASSRVPELLKIFEIAKQLGDETTTLPSYTHGEQDKGVSRTVGGLSMLMGAATVTIKDVVRNYDDGISKPFIGSLYDWNMQFGTDESIKGDYQVKARGSSSLVAKELYGEQLDRLADSTANPMDAPHIKRNELVRARFTARDLDPERFTKTQPEVEDELRSQVSDLQQQLASVIGQLQKHMQRMPAGAPA